MAEHELKQIRESLCLDSTPERRRAPLQALAMLAASGNSEALDLLLASIDTFRLSRPAITRQLFNPADRDEVEQDVLLNVARSISAFRGDAHFLSWLHRVATNCALNHVARQQRNRESPVQVPTTESAHFTSLATTRMIVQEAISELPELYRSAVTLRDIEQFSYQEVADRLELPLNTTRSRIARGRAIVVEHMNENLAGTGTW